MWDTCTSHFGPKKFDRVGRRGQGRSKYGTFGSYWWAIGPCNVMTSSLMPFSNPLNKTNWCSRYRGPGWQVGAIRKPALCRSLLHSQNEEFEDEGDQGDHNEMKSVNIRGSIFLLSPSSLRRRWRTWGKDDLASGSVTSTGSPRPRSDNSLFLLLFIQTRFYFTAKVCRLWPKVWRCVDIGSLFTCHPSNVRDWPW